jgi:hypothetical protein
VLAYAATSWSPDARAGCEFLSALAAETLVGLQGASTFIAEHLRAFLQSSLLPLVDTTASHSKFPLVAVNTGQEISNK